MEKNVAAILLSEGSKLLSDGIRLMMARPRRAARYEEEPYTPPVTVREPAPQKFIGPVAVATPIALPTREETNQELKRRLARELYRAELDLAGGLKIAGKPCDCLSNKHTLGLEAMAEELISADPNNPVYNEIIQWIKDNTHKLTVEAIDSGKYAQEYPGLASQFKDFRKRILGTDAFQAMVTNPSKMTLDEAKEIASSQAKKEVERQWHSQEKK
jgi:hypothetical protein